VRISLGKSMGYVGKVDESGVRCRGFYVNEYRRRFCCGRSDSVCGSVGMGNRGRKRLV
jgi:hypothetical protein